MTTKRSSMGKLAAIPTGAIEANTAGTLPNALASSNAVQPSETASVMQQVAALTGESSPTTAK